jgi:hypothetical protein
MSISISISVSIYLILVVLEILNSGPMLARQVLYHLNHAPNPSFLLLIIFLIGSCVYAQAVLDHNPAIYASHVAGMADTYHHTQLLLVEMGSH